GTIEEEVYVCQPLGFKDHDYPDKVYKVVKALYGLHQAPRAWYETLATYLLENGFQRGTIDQTLFIKKQKRDILLVQIYVDDIIFGATNKDLCRSFEKLMKDKFQMSSMGELTFFLGLRVKQKKDGIFISQDKYVAKILRKFGLTEGKLASTPIDTDKPLLKDPDGEDVDVHTYRSMMCSLMYLTSSRPDIMFAVCACARFQVTPKNLHLHAVKRIFRYLKGKPHLGLWYPKDSPFDLVAYSDSDYAGASLDKKSTTGGCQFFGCRLISWQYKKQTVIATSFTEAEYVAAASCYAQVLWIQNQLLNYGSGILSSSNNLMTSLEIFAELAHMGYEKPSTKLTFYKACFSSQWKFLIHTILQSLSVKRTYWNEFSLAMASAVVCLSTGDLSTHTTKYISPALSQKVFANMRRVGKGFSGVETPLFEGILVGVIEEEDQSIPSPTLPTLPPQQSQDLPSTSHRIDTSNDTVMEDASNQGRMLDALDSDAGVALMDDKEDEKKLKRLRQEVVDVVTTAKLITEVVTAASESVTAASTTIAAAEPQGPEEESTTIIPAETKSKDKGKGIMVEEPKPMKKKKQVEMDEEYARKLHEELNKDIDWDVAIDLLEEEENRAIESINETPAQKASKRRKLNEEVEDLKQHLEIVPDEDVDVYTEATPLARKVPVVDYEIIHLNNKPHYKIIRADGTHQLFGVDAAMDLEEKH
nr:uncharacterized mitochondrial protein AtMg00810-like [Tanacetum cinerariifolium]